MRGKNPKNLYNLVPADISRGLHQALGQVYRLYPLWEKAVDAPTARHSRPAGYANGVLTIQVESPIWVAALRRQQRALIEQLRQMEEFRNLQDIRVKVVPGGKPVGPAQSFTRSPAPVSSSASAAIGRTADSVSDENLKAALKRLQRSADSRKQ